jgi:hypothetical protein
LSFPFPCPQRRAPGVCARVRVPPRLRASRATRRSLRPARAATAVYLDRRARISDAEGRPAHSSGEPARGQHGATDGRIGPAVDGRADHAPPAAAPRQVFGPVVQAASGTASRTLAPRPSAARRAAETSTRCDSGLRRDGRRLRRGYRQTAACVCVGSGAGARRRRRGWTVRRVRKEPPRSVGGGATGV